MPYKLVDSLMQRFK